jgi:hypothetical protein
MTKTYKILGAFLAAIALLFGATITYGAVTSKIANQATGYSQNYTFFTATTTAATSTTLATSNDPGFFTIAGAKKVELYFSRAATSSNTGTSVFRVQVTPDGVNWYNFSTLIGTDVSATATSTVTISAATSTTVVSMDVLKNAFYAIRCVSTFTIDGTETCKAYAEY